MKDNYTTHQCIDIKGLFYISLDLSMIGGVYID